MVLPINDRNVREPYFNDQPSQSISPKVNLASQELIGNDKEFRISTNHINLTIIGNNNRIFIRKNKGSIQIVGNYVKMKIIRNYASIKYVGNCGRVYMGKASPNTNLQYTGSSGKLKLVAEELFNEKHFPMSAPRTKRPNECCKQPHSSPSPDEPQSFSLFYSEKGNEEYDYRCTKPDTIKHHHHHHNNSGDIKRCDSMLTGRTAFKKYSTETETSRQLMTMNQKLGKLNMSLPNISLTFDTSTEVESEKKTKSLKISCSTGNINIHSYYHVT
jgi:hypothetical protein